jgi:hypothetical protein
MNEKEFVYENYKILKIVGILSQIFKPIVNFQT